MKLYSEQYVGVCRMLYQYQCNKYQWPAISLEVRQICISDVQRKKRGSQRISLSESILFIFKNLSSEASFNCWWKDDTFALIFSTFLFQIWEVWLVNWILEHLLGPIYSILNTARIDISSGQKKIREKAFKLLLVSCRFPFVLIPPQIPDTNS